MDASARFTALLWHRPGHLPPERLRTALRAKGIATIDVTSACAALAEACAIRMAPATAEGKRPGGGIVIVFPEQHVGTSALLEAVGRYAPGTRCWTYGPAESPRLTPVQAPADDGQDGAEPAGEAPAARDYGKSGHGEAGSRESGSGAPNGTGGHGAVLPGVEPKLKLTEPDGVSVGSDMAEEDDEQPPLRRPLLSAEELAMLLGDEPGDARGDDRGGQD